MNEQEIWKDIPGYEGLYQVSNLGRVKSFHHNNKILRQWSNNNGYLFVSLNRKYNSKHFRVHRLVAKAFIPNPKNYTEVNHKDECKSNNVVSNLEWCNHSYNALYGTCQERLRKHKIQPVQLIEKRTNNVVQEFDSIKTAMERTGFSRGFISNVCRGVSKTAGIYTWRYAEKRI